MEASFLSSESRAIKVFRTFLMIGLYQLFTHTKCPNCGNRFSKDARYCNTCSYGNIHEWRSCRNCGAKVGMHSDCCWRCRANLFEQSPEKSAGGVWKREFGEVAIRFPLRFSGTVLEDSVTLEEGTMGALFVNGRYEEDLKPGYQKFGDDVGAAFWKKLYALSDKGKRTEVLLAPERAFKVPVQIREGVALHSGEAVIASFELSLKVGDLVRVGTQLMAGKGSGIVTTGDLESLLLPYTMTALGKCIADRSSEELVGLRYDVDFFDRALRSELEQKIEEYGLAYVRLEDVVIAGEFMDNFMLDEIEGRLRRRELDLRKEILTEHHEFERYRQVLEDETELQRQASEVRIRLSSIRAGDRIRSEERDGEVIEEKHRIELERIRLEGELKKIKAMIQLRESCGEKSGEAHYPQGIESPDEASSVGSTPDAKDCGLPFVLSVRVPKVVRLNIPFSFDFKLLNVSDTTLCHLQLVVTEAGLETDKAAWKQEILRSGNIWDSASNNRRDSLSSGTLGGSLTLCVSAEVERPRRSLFARYSIPTMIVEGINSGPITVTAATANVSLVEIGSRTSWMKLKCEGNRWKPVPFDVFLPVTDSPISSTSKPLHLSFGGVPRPEDGFRMGRKGSGRLVELSNGFWMGKRPVTRREYEAVMGVDAARVMERVGSGAEHRTHRDPDAPVTYITRKEALEFCEKLTEIAGRERWLSPSDDLVFRLPTEAEWEYACDGGVGQSLSERENHDAFWTREVSRHRLSCVSPLTPGDSGYREPNGFGLHDLRGLVWEWCHDLHSDELPHEVDPCLHPKGRRRELGICRGGSYANLRNDSEAWTRFACPIQADAEVAKERWHYKGTIGFRVALGRKLAERM
jgi:formylglycine-generating enzyme required for sulfatase activity